MIRSASGCVMWPAVKSFIRPSSIVTRLQRKIIWSGRALSPLAAASIGARPE